MNYICLRDCFVNSRFWHEGRTYELPDNMEKTPKNFKLINKPEALSEAPELPMIITKPAFTCPVCRKVLTAKIALAGHMRSHK